MGVVRTTPPQLPPQAQRPVQAAERRAASRDL